MNSEKSEDALEHGESMDFLLILLGIQIMVIGLLAKPWRTVERSGKTPFQVWGLPVVLFATGTVLILLGILYRFSRHH